jgi:hypothetical protein
LGPSFVAETPYPFLNSESLRTLVVAFFTKAVGILIDNKTVVHLLVRPTALYTTLDFQKLLTIVESCNLINTGTFYELFVSDDERTTYGLVRVSNAYVATVHLPMENSVL